MAYVQNEYLEDIFRIIYINKYQTKLHEKSTRSVVTQAYKHTHTHAHEHAHRDTLAR